MNLSKVMNYTANVFQKYLSSARKIKIKAFEHQRENNQQSIENVDRIVKSAINNLQVITTSFPLRLQKLAERKLQAQSNERTFQAERNIYRPVKFPDILTTILLSVFGAVAETIMTSTGLVADGHVEPIVGFGFGLMFSSVTVALGLMTGYFCLRYINYKTHATVLNPTDLTKRHMARFGLGSSLLTLLIMVFTAARVRITGGHDNLFSFDEVSFAATFNDGLAIVIMIVAVLSYCIALWKGHSGFSDPEPDYADHAGFANEEIDELAEEIVEDTLDDIDDTFEAAEDFIMSSSPSPEDETEIFSEIQNHNDAVIEEKLKAEVFFQQECERAEFIQQEKMDRPNLDFDVFDQLLIKTNALKPTESHNKILSELKQAHSVAITTIHEAYAEYKANSQALPITPPSH